MLLQSSFRPKVEDDVSLLDDEVPPDVHAMAAYYADDGDLAATNEVSFCPSAMCLFLVALLQGCR